MQYIEVCNIGYVSSELKKISNSKAYLAPSLEKDGGPVSTMQRIQICNVLIKKLALEQVVQGETEDRGGLFQIGRWQIK